MKIAELTKIENRKQGTKSDLSIASIVTQQQEENNRPLCDDGCSIVVRY